MSKRYVYLLSDCVDGPVVPRTDLRGMLEAQIELLKAQRSTIHGNGSSRLLTCKIELLQFVARSVLEGRGQWTLAHRVTERWVPWIDQPDSADVLFRSSFLDDR